MKISTLGKQVFLYIIGIAFILGVLYIMQFKAASKTTPYVVVIHGYNGSSHVDWFPPLAQKMQADRVNYTIPDLPGGEYPQAEAWLQTVHTNLVGKQEPYIFVGYSLGTRAALLYLEKYAVKTPLVVLVAAFSNSTANAQKRNGVYASFFTHEINLTKIKRQVGKIIILHSKDDTTVEYAQAVELAKDLGADLITFENKGHFSDPANAEIIYTFLKSYVTK